MVVISGSLDLSNSKALHLILVHRTLGIDYMSNSKQSATVSITVRTFEHPQSIFIITNTLVLLSLGDTQLCPRGEQHRHHLDVEALLVSKGFLQFTPLSSRKRTVRGRHLSCETFIL